MTNRFYKRGRSNRALTVEQHETTEEAESISLDTAMILHSSSPIIGEESPYVRYNGY